MEQRRRRALPAAVLLAAGVLLVLPSWLPFSLPRAFIGTAAEGDLEEPAARGPLGWLHYDVILAARTSYPLALMIGFTCYGNVLLRKECGDQRYPTWLFGWMLGMICYTYPD